MSRRPSAASWSSRASVLFPGALLLFACWIGCELDRSGLSSGVTPPPGSGGHTQNEPGTGGVSPGTGGSSIHFGTGGLASGGHATGGSGGSGGQIVPASGGAAGVVVGSGGDGDAGQGTGGLIAASGGVAGQVPPGKGGTAGQPPSTGSGGPRAGGRGGMTTGTGGWWNGSGNTGGGGWNSGTGGASGGIPMCDASIRDKDTCGFGAPDCRKTCGVSELGTKPCSCTNRQWNCGDCAYPAGNYSCYELPASGPVPPCPPNTVNGMTSCFGDCTLCANYTDTSGMAKTGYCACNQDPGDTQRLYHCASSSEWPPQ